MKGQGAGEGGLLGHPLSLQRVSPSEPDPGKCLPGTATLQAVAPSRPGRQDQVKTDSVGGLAGKRFCPRLRCARVGRRVRAPSDSRPPGQSVAAPHASRCVKAGTARARPRRYSSYFGEGISCRTSFLKGACRKSLGALLGTCRPWPFRLSAASVTRQLHRTKAPGFLTPLASLSRRFGAIAAHRRTWPTPNAACGRAESSSLSATGIPHEPDP